MTIDYCVHKFILPPPNGTTSLGVCELCGLEREMFNYDEKQYGGWRAVEQSKKDKGGFV